MTHDLLRDRLKTQHPDLDPEDFDRVFQRAVETHPAMRATDPPCEEIPQPQSLLEATPLPQWVYFAWGLLIFLELLAIFMTVLHIARRI